MGSEQTQAEGGYGPDRASVPRTLNPIRRDHPDIGIYTTFELVAHGVATSLNGALLVLASTWLWRHVAQLGRHVYALPLALGLGLLLADFVSGLMHWALDTWFDAETPALGRMVKTVREHHVFPDDVFAYKLYHHVGILSASAFAATAPFLVPVLVWVDSPRIPHLLLVATLLVMSLGIVLMFEVHKIGHRRHRPRLLRWFGLCHFVLTPEHHLRHHRMPYNYNYCLVTGWADLVMNHVDGWRHLERLVTRCTGAVPREDDRRWRDRYLRGRGREADPPVR
jgi:hypothetical protein